ncbi:hypothetical protein VPNG_07099 [Cytospora leucostoma]|uniref:Uncharacterized protein n=1 Tax=Cytospora leucostoma TaxID=1230097 RepID=A0A423WVP8_9PEZI|nr:hypothetical protein VPNG_07099 [Cytospora leucostoma]
MNRLSILLFLLGAFASLAVAASAPTFCKCTCFTNSTIIEITPKSSRGSTTSHLKTPTEVDNTDNQEEEPTTTSDPSTLRRSFLDAAAAAADDDDDDDDDDMNATLFPHPSTKNQRRRPRHPKSRRQRPNAAAAPPSKRAQVSATCNQCNKAFCLSQSLPICKSAADKDVVTMCFQRDSRKDQIIVWGFIMGTAGLLGWAGVQKVMALRGQGSFMGLPGVFGGWLGRSRGNTGGAAGGDAGRGAYVAVGGHSRSSSVQTTN